MPGAGVISDTGVGTVSARTAGTTACDAASAFFRLFQLLLVARTLCYLLYVAHITERTTSLGAMSPMNQSHRRATEWGCFGALDFREQVRPHA